MESDPLLWLGHLTLLFLAPPIFLGIIAKTKALFAGRKGPPVLQLYHDLFKLFRKGEVFGRPTGFIFRACPAAILALILTAGLFLPIIGTAPLHFQGDLILFAALIGFSRFLLIAMALDTGSSFEGMGASREAAFGALSEISFFLVLAVLAVTTQNRSVRFLLITGQPIREPIAWYGPIVMNTQEELKTAFQEYQAGTFIKPPAWR